MVTNKKRITNSRLNAQTIRSTRSTVESNAKKHSTAGGMTSVSSLNNLEVNISQVIERLREFDLDMTYGPCIGISRLIRWERARRLGLEPPAEIKLFLTNEQCRKNIRNIEDDLWQEKLNSSYY